MLDIFQYLQVKKGKPIPFLYKVLYNIPLTQDDLTIRGSLYLYNSKITSLPNNLTVNGYLNLYKSNIKSLPNNLTVNGILDIECTKISILPEDLYVNDDLYCYGTPLADNIKKDLSLLTKYQKQIKGRILW